MTKSRAVELSSKLEKVLSKFAEENELNLQYKGSSYSKEIGAFWKPKFEFHDTSEIPVDSSFEKENFKNAVARTWNAKAEWYGQKMTLLSGKEATVIEFHPRKSKYPIIVKDNLGVKYKVPIAMFLERRINAK